MEYILQTRLPEAMATSLKMEALVQKDNIKRRVSHIIDDFVNNEPWLKGTWIKQPKTTAAFKPMAVKLPLEQGRAFEALAAQLEVSTSSLAYTAIDWHLQAH